MTSESRSPIDRVVAAMRDDESPPPGVRERVRGRLLAGPGAAPRSSERVVPSAAWITWRSSVLAVAAFVVGTLVGAGVHARLWPSGERSDAPAAATGAGALATAAEPVVPPSATVPASPPPGVHGSSETVARPAPSAPPVGKPRASADAGDSQLTMERRILDQARAALVAGEASEALDKLARHRRVFRNGILADERDALRVEALVKAGRYDEARTLAQDFLRRTPDSLFASTVRSALDSIPMTDRTGAANPH